MSKKLKLLTVVFSLVLITSVSFFAGCITGFNTSQNGGAGLAVVNQAWSAIYKNYVDPTKLNSTNLSQGAIEGIMTALDDPYSAYLDPQMSQLFQNNLTGKFEGIGAEVTLSSDNRPMIVAPLRGSPAEKAGIKSGDIIMAIDGKSTEGQSLIEVILSIRGPAGTSVNLTVLHQGDTTPVEIQIVRAQITSSSVDYEMKGDIAYIRIYQFVETTNGELNDALTALDLKNASGIVLDLRSNPGGLVPTVVDVASHFIKHGVIITLVDNKGNRTSNSVNPNGVFTDLPMVVLVDSFSASGSEVLTGALRDYQRAMVAGNRTFGKGSYNIDIPLQDGSDIYLTVGRWLTPNGQLIEGKGIEPDYVLTETGNAEIQWAIDFLKKPK